MDRYVGFVSFGFSWIMVLPALLLLLSHIRACKDNNEYATTLFAGKFSYTTTASIELFDKGLVLLSSSSGNFFLSMLSCKLVVAHNDTTPSHVVVWSSLFPRCQMGNQYKLLFLESGNFVIRMGQKHSSSASQLEELEVWATNTQGHGVTTMQLKDDGNLVLYNTKNDPVWQSFDHPLSTLLSGQVLKQGMALSLSEDLYKYSLVIELNRAAFYVIDIITQDHKPYWELRPNSSINTTIAFAALDEEGNFQLYDSASNPLVVYQISSEENIRNGGDRAPLINQMSKEEAANFGENRSPTNSGRNYVEIKNESTHKTLNIEESDVKFKNESTRMAVKKIGKDIRKSAKFNQNVATFGGDLWRVEVTSTVIGQGGSIVKQGGNLDVYHWCSREGTWSLHSRAINKRCQFPRACPSYRACQGEEGECRDIPGVPPNLAGTGTDRDCEKTTFVGVKNMSYFAVEMGVGGSGLHKASLAECKSACMRNCSCAAFVYHQDAVLSCYPIYENQPLSFLAISNPLSSAYVRIPSSSNSSIPPSLIYLPLLFLLFCSSFLESFL
ncbi:hypothetical protein GOP47_0027901 [Adiantum capillus-veneris]|nr:hypothetical protein GOP47_0027901 [Adiantum capillus-veneris]